MGALMATGFQRAYRPPDPNTGSFPIRQDQRLSSRASGNPAALPGWWGPHTVAPRRIIAGPCSSAMAVLARLHGPPIGRPQQHGTDHQAGGRPMPIQYCCDPPRPW